jgi:hypothetical protein
MFKDSFEGRNQRNFRFIIQEQKSNFYKTFCPAVRYIFFFPQLRKEKGYHFHRG